MVRIAHVLPTKGAFRFFVFATRHLGQDRLYWAKGAMPAERYRELVTIYLPTVRAAAIAFDADLDLHLYFPSWLDFG